MLLLELSFLEAFGGSTFAPGKVRGKIIWWLLAGRDKGGMELGMKSLNVRRV